MNTDKNIGLIECGLLLKPLDISPSTALPGDSIKKVLSTSSINELNIKSKYPLAEVVDDTKAIINDSSIELIIISNPSHEDMGIVGQAIAAGKHIRII